MLPRATLRRFAFCLLSEALSGAVFLAVESPPSPSSFRLNARLFARASIGLLRSLSLYLSISAPPTSFIMSSSDSDGRHSSSSLNSPLCLYLLIYFPWSFEHCELFVLIPPPSPFLSPASYSPASRYGESSESLCAIAQRSGSVSMLLLSNAEAVRACNSPVGIDAC